MPDASNSKRRALGRGLDALIPAGKGPAPPAGKPADNRTARVEDLHPNRAQPRKHFADDSLQELADSIRELGILEPILVRQVPGQAGFQIIAGERRWKAAQRAGVLEVPIHVREFTDVQVFEAALVENIQREDLNPIEVARAYQNLISEHGHTQESVAERTGRGRATVANAMRLLKLPARVLDLVEGAILSEGHGRALLGCPDARTIERLAKLAVDKQWSVRETERQTRAAVAKAAAQTPGPTSNETPEPTASANVRALEGRLSRQLGSKVQVAERRGKGHLKIHFRSLDELDRLLEVLEGEG